jgi:hypothetical protein
MKKNASYGDESSRFCPKKAAEMQMSADISLLEKEISEMDERIKTGKENIGNLQTQINDLYTELSAKKMELERIDTEIAKQIIEESEQQINNLQSLKEYSQFVGFDFSGYDFSGVEEELLEDPTGDMEFSVNTDELSERIINRSKELAGLQEIQKELINKRNEWDLALAGLENQPHSLVLEKQLRQTFSPAELEILYDALVDIVYDSREDSPPLLMSQADKVKSVIGWCLHQKSILEKINLKLADFDEDATFYDEQDITVSPLLIRLRDEVYNSSNYDIDPENSNKKGIEISILKKNLESINKKIDRTTSKIDLLIKQINEDKSKYEEHVSTFLTLQSEKGMDLDDLLAVEGRDGMILGEDDDEEESVELAKVPYSPTLIREVSSLSEDLSNSPVSPTLVGAFPHSESTSSTHAFQYHKLNIRDGHFSSDTSS